MSTDPNAQPRDDRGRSRSNGDRDRSGTGSTGLRSGDWRHLSTLFEQLPPNAVEAEMSLLGSMILDPRVIGDVLLVIRSGEDFYTPANGRLFDVMVELYDKHASLDIVQLNQLLIDRNLLDSIGGQDYLLELAEAVPTASNATYYARLVREKAMIRHLIAAAGDVLYDAYHSPEDAASILEQAEQKIFHIAQQSEQSSAESLNDLIQETIKILEQNEGRQITGVASGFAEFDEMTGGLQPGEMLVLAARPSMGKTALALNVAEQVARQGKGVAVFSLEMSKQQLVQRLLCASSGVDSQRLRRNMLNREEWTRLLESCDDLSRAPLYIDDTPGLSMMAMRAKARRMVARYGIEAVVIDYLQLMSSGGRVESRQQEVSEISRSVKAMARELNVPVLCLSQLNRAAEQREGHRPRMSDLRESGSIEQDADVIMMLHREEYYHVQDPNWADENEDKVGLAELIIAKQRNGPTGTVRLTWVSESTRFRNYTPQRAPGGYYEPKAPAIETEQHGGGGGGGQDSSSNAPGSAFSDRRQTGPVQDFRDGGGPTGDSDFDVPF